MEETLKILCHRNAQYGQNAYKMLIIYENAYILRRFGGCFFLKN